MTEKTMTKPKKVVIFAGGAGTRLSEQTKLIPKPLVPVGDVPIIVHVMRQFYAAGFREFIIAVGYKSDAFKKYFREYSLSKRDVVFTKYGYQVSDCDDVEDWKITIVETGEKASTGQRLHRVAKYLDKDEPFFLTYGDSVSDVNLEAVEEAHFSQDKTLITVTAIDRVERFGILKVGSEGVVESFGEKSANSEELINGGFILCDPEVLKRVTDESGDFAYEILERMANEGLMSYYHHKGFWHAMDTQRDLDELNELWKTHPEYFAGHANS